MAKKGFFEQPLLNIVLQQLAENEFSLRDISAFDLEPFSQDKILYDYQQEALTNALRHLLTFYDPNQYDADKHRFYFENYNKYSHDNLDFTKPTKLLSEYYPVARGPRIEFYHFVNRMSFWMTMGSGKTIVIIKLIELLDKAMAMGMIPTKPILFFTANQELLERFHKEIDGYNALKDRRIMPYSLKQYEHIRSGIKFNAIDIFTYRADLMGEDGKENQLDFKDYLNHGEHYVILDEAHKGDKEESKRQNIFSILSQNGFLFNFSATFTDKRDLATTIYNLNQGVWIKKGYGKKLFLLDNDLKAFKDKTDLNDGEKQKALVKSLILLAFSKEYKLAVQTHYYNPMMVVFTNSVNINDADAKLFFRQIRMLLLQNKCDVEAIFEEAKAEIYKEFKATQYLVSDQNGEAISEFADAVQRLEFDAMKRTIFYQTSGNIEAIINPKDKSEIAFKLDTSDQIFGLLKIGNINSWTKDELEAIKITDSYKDKEEGYFKSLDESDINILIGSRSFYEGWDTNRPNIMLFLNIGMNKDTKKFVTQSIGRGMRINSVDNSRQRLSFIDTPQKATIADKVKPLETLFVISTNKQAIETIIQSQSESDALSDWQEIALEKNEIPAHQILYIPQYKATKQEITKLKKTQNFKLSPDNLEALRAIINHMDEALFVFIFGIKAKQEYDILYEMISGNHFDADANANIHYKSIDLLMDKLKNRLHVNQLDINGFKTLSDEITHFKKIKVLGDYKESLEQAIKDSLDDCKVTYNNASVKKLSAHYYNPIITQENSAWIKNIITVPSEVNMVNELLKIIDEIDGLFDWWRFSKLNEYHDTDIYIPYTEDGIVKKFHPDFIFWLQKGNRHKILFIDPKGIQNASYQLKIDGYEKLFKDKRFNQNNMEIEVALSLYKYEQSGQVGKQYADYWVDKGKLINLFKRI